VDVRERRPLDRGVCVITGGGRGIGAATARQAASAGWRVCLSWHADREAAEEVAGEIEGRAVRAEVADEADVVGLFAAAAEMGPVTAAVANAGIVAIRTRLEAMDAARMRRVLEVNVLGVMLTAREAVRRMSTRRGGGGGAIVTVSSAASRLGSPDEYVDYAASKGAVDSFTLGLAREVAAEGIRVNAVRPGITETGMHASGGQPDRVTRLAPMIPMGRAGRPDEVAAAIVWLLGDDSPYTTGAILDVTGGR
jgi:NAD(P)-dependent dehydrogenase (short-subunit alcohol dehydrogenase family)